MAGLSLKTMRDARLSLVGRLLAAIAAFLLFIGIAGAVIAATGVEIPVAGIAAGLVCAGIVAALGGIFGGAQRAELITYGVIAALLAVLCLALGGSVLGGAAQVANAMIERVGERTQMYPLPFKAGGEGDLVMFCALASAAVSLVCSALLQRGFAVPCLVAVGVLAAGVVVQWIPIGWWVLALAAGVLSCLCVRTALKGVRLTTGALLWPLAAVALACVLAGSGAALAALGGATGSADRANAAIERLLYTMSYGNAEFAMPEGQLNDLHPLAASDQEAMTVTVDQPTFEYLRGFVGERYDSGSWTALQARDVMDNRSLLYWLDEDGFANSDQLSQSARLVGYEDANPATIAQQLQTVRKPYAYLPYSYAQGSPAQATTDMAQMRLQEGGKSAYEFDASLTRRAYLLQDAVDGAQTKADTASGSKDAEDGAEGVASLRTYLDDNRAYGDFAAQAYREVSEEVASAFQKLYGPPVELTCEQAKLQVQALLDDSVTYSTEVRTENGDQDFVEYFLTESCSGYSVHYATAATLLMRYYGVPARYVEGYVLNTAALDKLKEEKAEEAKKAKKADEEVEQPAGTYTLTEEQAHAWVEYYLDGVGWIPFDVTPEWRHAGYYETTDNAELIDESQNWSIGEAQQDAVWTPPTEEQSEEEDDDETTTSPLDSLWGMITVSWPWVLLGFLLTLLIAFIIRDVLLHARLRKFLAQSDDASVPAQQSVPALFSYLVLLLESCGKAKLSNEPYAQQAGAVGELGFCSEEELLRAVDANDRALFAAQDVGEDDVRAVRACIDAVRAGLKRKTGLAQRFAQRHIHCLW